KSLLPLRRGREDHDWRYAFESHLDRHNPRPMRATSPQHVWHGVNLGNWLLLERWIQPSLFAGAADARDEHGLCSALGDGAEAHMRRHRETYVTADDFVWLARYGIDAVRIPFGYWLVEPTA